MSGNRTDWTPFGKYEPALEDPQPITDEDDKPTGGEVMVEVEDDSASIRSHASDQQVEIGSNSGGEESEEQPQVEFEELFPISEGRHQGQVEVSFCGAQWKMLVLVQDSAVGVYAAVANMKELPQAWDALVVFSFTLVHPTDEEHNLRSSEDRFLFRWVSDLYADRGYPRCFLLGAAEKYQYEPGKILIRCKLRDGRWVPPPYNSKRATGMVGIQNLGATCYLNSLLQMLYHLNSFRKAVYDIPVNGEDAVDSSMTLALQGVFYNLQTSDTEVSTHDLTKAFGWDSLEAFQQQDVQEMMRVLLDRLEEKMKKTPVDGMVQKLFEGQVQSYIRCVNVDFSSKREEAFYDIQLDVKGCRNLTESFERYVAKEMLNGENQYDAEGFGKQDAEKGVIFYKFPPVLTIHLKRFEFDLARFGFSKIHDRFEFPMRICLDEFVSEDAPPEHRQGNTYILHSVLVHSGDVMGGHYTAFIRPSPPNDYSQWMGASDEEIVQPGSQWFKFDDEIVSKSTEHDAVVRNFGDGLAPGLSPLSAPRRIVSMSSAYMLVYIRESTVMEVMRPISEEEIPSTLKQRLHEEERRKRREEVLRLEEKRYVNIPYATEQHVADFKDYSHRLDFVICAKLPKVRLLRTANNIGLLRALACELQVPPCRLRLWPIINRENSTTRIDVPPEQEPFADVHKSIYVELLPEDERFARYVQKLDELDAEEARLLQQYGVRSPPYTWRNGPVDRSLTQQDDINPSEALLFGVGIGMGNAQAHSNKNFALKLQALEEQYDEVLHDAEKLYHRDENEHLIFLKLFDPSASYPIRYLGSMLFDMEQLPQALFEAALQLAGLSEDQAHGVRLYEELTPSDLIDVFESEGETLSQKQHTSGDIFVLELPSSNAKHDDLEDSEIEDDEERVTNMFEAKTAKQFFLIHAMKKRIVLVPASRNDELIFQAAMEASGGESHEFPGKPEAKWQLDPLGKPELKLQLRADMNYREACILISRHLGIANPLRLQLLPLTESRRVRPYQLPAQMIKEGIRIQHLLGSQRSGPPVLKVAIAPFPCTVDDSIRSLEINIADARLRQQRRQYLLSLQPGVPMNGRESPAVSEDSRSQWQVDEPIDQSIALTEPQLCLPVPADSLSERLVYTLADPTRPMASLASHVRHRCGLQHELEEQFEEEVRLTETGGTANGNGAMNGNHRTDGAHGDAEAGRRLTRITHTTTEAQADDAQHGVLLFTSSTQKVDRIFLPTDMISEIAYSWMENPAAGRLERLNAQLVTATEARYMLRRGPVNSIPVKVLFFTMYGQMAQPLPECDMFVMYLREDDTMDSLLTRLARITGDPDRLVQKYRLAVVKDFIPHFLHRGMEDAAVGQKRVRDAHDQAEDKQQDKKTRVARENGEAEAKEEEEEEEVVPVEAAGDTEADENVQPDMQISQDLNGSPEEHHGGSDGSEADSEQPTSVWSKFQRFHPLYMSNGNRSVLLNTDDYPILGVQRPSGEWGARRVAHRFATGIKIR